MNQTLLIELGCEELPAKQIRKQAELLLDGVSRRLIDGSLCEASAARRWLATPRRLAVIIEQVAERQPDRMLERKGPAEQAAFDKHGQPTPAALGFARSVGLEVDELERLENEQGKWLYAEVRQAGKGLTDLLPEWLEKTVRDMAGARSMRWSDRNDRFLRPVRWIAVLHGDRVVPFSLFGLKTGSETLGHRIHAAGRHSLRHADEYVTVLKNAYVIADFDERRTRIHQQIVGIGQSENLQINAAADASKLQDPFTDKANSELLDEVCGLVEWPVATLGSFDPAFLEVPGEALVSAMREHQKCFALYEASGRLAPKFIAIANLESIEPVTMAHGYERVIRPRLADARFFYQQDLKTPLSEYLPGLQSAVFHPKLGSLFDKTQRMIQLAGDLAESFETDPETCARAAELAKCDLMTQMVGEFPELQGTMGRYYAATHGEDPAVADAIESHYQPRSAGDRLPTDRPGLVVALADRLDTLVGIFAAGQKPKGSKDPFALRRAALAVVRILDRSGSQVTLMDVLKSAADALKPAININESTVQQVESFITDRLMAWLSSEYEVETNTMRAVAAGSNCSVHDFVLRCRQLQTFADSNDAMTSLVAANKRAANILRKSNKNTFNEVNRNLIQIDAESTLFDVISQMRPEIRKTMQAGNFEDALNQLAQTRPALDAFFDNVMVMDDRNDIRDNRLALLSELRSLFLQVADIALMGRA